jgi:hypothetical protein
MRELEEQEARLAALAGWRVKEKELLVAYVEEKREAAEGDVFGPAYDAMTAHYYRPPKFTSSKGVLVSVVPGLDHSKWLAARAVVLEALKEPIEQSNKLQEEATAEKKMKSKEKRDARLLANEPKMSDVTNTHQGLFLGGNLPEQIQHVVEVATRQGEEKSMRALVKKGAAKEKEMATLLEAKQRLESQTKRDLTKPQREAVVVRYLKLEGAEDGRIKETRKNMATSAAASKQTFDDLVAKLAAENISVFPWTAMGVVEQAVAPLNDTAAAVSDVAVTAMGQSQAAASGEESDGDELVDAEEDEEKSWYGDDDSDKDDEDDDDDKDERDEEKSWYETHQGADSDDDDEGGDDENEGENGFNEVEEEQPSGKAREQRSKGKQPVAENPYARHHTQQVRQSPRKRSSSSSNTSRHSGGKKKKQG